MTKKIIEIDGEKIEIPEKILKANEAMREQFKKFTKAEEDYFSSLHEMEKMMYQKDVYRIKEEKDNEGGEQ